MNPEKSGVDRTEGMEVMEEASLSRVRWMFGFKECVLTLDCHVGIYSTISINIYYVQKSNTPHPSSWNFLSFTNNCRFKKLNIFCVIPKCFPSTACFPVCAFSADRFVKSLAQIVPIYRAEHGQSGGNKNCYGRNGSSTYISVSAFDHT